MIASLFILLKGITSLGNKVFAVVAPAIDPNTQEPLEAPYAVMRVVSSMREYTHDGFSKLVSNRVQVSIFAKGYLEAIQIADAAVLLVEGWPAVQGAFLINQLDLFDEPAGLYHIPVDFTVWHNL